VRVLCPNEDKATGFWTTTAIPSKLFRGVIPRQPVGMMRRWLVVDAYSVFGLLFILETLLDFLPAVWKYSLRCIARYNLSTSFDPSNLRAESMIAMPTMVKFMHKF